MSTSETSFCLTNCIAVSQSTSGSWMICGVAVAGGVGVAGGVAVPRLAQPPKSRAIPTPKSRADAFQCKITHKQFRMRSPPSRQPLYQPLQCVTSRMLSAHIEQGRTYAHMYLIIGI